MPQGHFATARSHKFLCPERTNSFAVLLLGRVLLGLVLDGIEERRHAGSTSGRQTQGGLMIYSTTNIDIPTMGQDTNKRIHMQKGRRKSKGMFWGARTSKAAYCALLRIPLIRCSYQCINTTQPICTLARLPTIELPLPTVPTITLDVRVPSVSAEGFAMFAATA